MRHSKQYEYRERGRAELRALSNRAMREAWTQEQFLREREAIIARLPEFPRTIRQWVREHGEGYHRALMDHNVVCMYCVDGALYRLTHDKHPELAHIPTWETLPRERYHDMPSGLYWVNNGKPARYF